jgi:hypothetical protein
LSVTDRDWGRLVGDGFPIRGADELH